MKVERWSAIIFFDQIINKVYINETFFDIF